MPRMFPATVTLPDGTDVTPTAVWWDDTTVAVFAARSDYLAGGPIVDNKRGPIVSVFTSQLTGDPTRDRDSGAWPTLDGELTAVSASGCGCGHPLKRYRPDTVSA